MQCIPVFIGFLSGDRASSGRINCCGWLDRWLGPPASSLLLGQQLVGHTIDWTAKENLTIRMCIMAAAHFDSSVFGVTLTHTQMYSFPGFSQQFTRPSQIPPPPSYMMLLACSCPMTESALHWVHIKSPAVLQEWETEK